MLHFLMVLNARDFASRPTNQSGPHVAGPRLEANDLQGQWLEEQVTTQRDPKESKYPIGRLQKCMFRNVYLFRGSGGLLPLTLANKTSLWMMSGKRFRRSVSIVIVCTKGPF